MDAYKKLEDLGTFGSLWRRRGGKDARQFVFAEKTIWFLL